MQAAKLLSRTCHIVPGKLRIGEYFFEVPFNYSKPAEGSLRLFARSIRRVPEGPEPEKDQKPLPWLLYLTGGPGFGCHPPQLYAWTRLVLDHGYQILFLDQRGTGFSQPITAQTLALKGNAVKQAEYLKHFRADNIVRDSEAIRQCLTADSPEDNKKWSVLGQSFGGFCSVTYLSMFPEGLKEVFTTGGLPPLVNGPDEPYKMTYKKVKERNEAYFRKYPEDVERLRKIYDYLAKEKPSVSGDGNLTPERFQQLGIMFGAHGGLDNVHHVVLQATNDLELFGFLTRPTLNTIDSLGGFDNNIIYAVLHEPLYCQGDASNWSADRLRSGNPAYLIDTKKDCPIYFTGEMIYRDMFESYGELRQVKEAADILAANKDWPSLYNEEQLAKNEVPVYSATYVDDMYVAYEAATATAAKIKGLKQFITNTMYHDALRSKSDEVIRQLFALKYDSID